MEYQNELDLQSHRYGLAGALSPRRIFRDLTDGLTLLWKTRKLTVAMASRELRVRYAGQFAGAFWIIGHPLFQMGVYIFIFGVVFQQRIGGSVELPRDYTTYILSGLVPWLTISTALPSLCNSVAGNANLVKQFTFQTEVFAVRDVLVSMIFWSVGIALLTIYGLAANRSLPWTYVLLPPVLLLTVIFTVGLGWMVSAVGVFIRDMKDVATVLATAGIYVLPVVYLPSWVPGLFKPFVEFNPLSALIWVYQDTFYFGRIEHPYAWLAFTVMSLLCFAFGYRLFQMLKPFFGKVL